jgi:glycosyltransferase involved in cell wall biosynthesis
MVELPNITVLVVTWNRPKIIRKTIYSLVKHLDYPREKMRWHLADDNSPGDYVNDILSEFHYLNWSYSITNRKGFGANVNKALKQINNKFIFFNEDDVAPFETINVVRGVQLLQNEKSVGLVRYDGIAGHTTFTLRLRETRLSKRDKFTYLTIENSQRPITYSNRPHLFHKRFLDYYGLYPEGLKLAKTERIYALHVLRNKGGPKIAILEDGIENKFTHLGAGKNSRQNTKDDVGK